MIGGLCGFLASTPRLENVGPDSSAPSILAARRSPRPHLSRRRATSRLIVDLLLTSFDRWADGEIDVSNKTRQQYRWAAGHIKTGLGGVRADQLERDDIARWLEVLAEEGRLSRRSIKIIRMVLRAALDDAVAVGRSPSQSSGSGGNAAPGVESSARAGIGGVD